MAEKNRVFCREPVFLAVVAFGGGIVLAGKIWHGPLVWLSSVLLLLAAAAFLARRIPRVSLVTVAVGFCFLGAFVAQYAPAQPAADIMRFSGGQEVVLTGYVVRDGVARQGSFGSKTESVDLAVEQAKVDGMAPVTANGGVRLTLYSRRQHGLQESDEGQDAAEGDQALPLFVYGQRLRLTAKLRPPLNYKNPGAWDYVAYLHSLGISALGSAKAEAIEVLPGSGGKRLESWRWTARRSVLRTIHRVWPAAQAGLFDGVLIGDRQFITREVRLEFQRSGTYHLLVVSGMNVAILAFALFWMLRRLRFRPEFATLAAILFSCGYACITDSGAPVLRAVLMFSVYQVTRLLYRERAALNAVGVAALALLVWNPRQLFEASFQMTFLSVIVIGGLAIPIFQRTSAPYRCALRSLRTSGMDQALAPRQAQFRVELRMVAGRVAKLAGKRAGVRVVTGIAGCCLAAYEVLVVSLLMQLAMALPMAWYFHRVTLTALPANCLIVPLIGLLMPAAVLAVAVGFFSLSLAQPAAWVASWALRVILGTVSVLGNVRVADYRIPTPELAVAAAAAASFVLALLLIRRRRALAVTGLLLLCGSAAWVGTHPARFLWNPGKMELTAIDVGQGDSLLIVTPEGKTLLLDSGGLVGDPYAEFDVGEDVVSPYLWARGIQRLDAVAISHGHTDHIGGMSAVIRNFHPAELWMGPQVSTSEFRALLQTADENHVSVRQHHAGECIELGGIHFAVLSPPADWQLKARVRDDDGMVLRASSGQRAVMLVGDAGRKVEATLIKGDIRADVLKVGHHGSNTATSAEFLAAVHPAYAVISSGTRNRFHHPRPQTLKTLAEAGVLIYRTDLMGATTFVLDPKEVSVSTWSSDQEIQITDDFRPKTPR